MDDTAGFYKYQEDIQTLLHGPNFVLNRDYELRKETKDTHTYPIDGWYWFESELTARQFFNLPENDPEPQESAAILSPIPTQLLR